MAQLGIVYTGEELIRSVRRMGVVARAGTTGQLDWDILTVLWEIELTKLLPRVMKLREDYFVVKTRTPLLPGVTEYPIPGRAAFQKVRDISLWDGTQNLNPQKCEIHGDYIVVSDTDAETGYQLEIHWYFRPGSINLSANCRQVSAVDAVAKTVELTFAPPAGWGLSLNVDVHSQYSGARIKLWDQPVTVAANVLTFTNAIDGSTYGTRLPEVGDWVCQAGWAALPAVPQEYGPTLAALAAHRILIASGDLKQAAEISKDLDAETREMLGITDVRVDRKPMRIPLSGTSLFPNG